MSQWYCTTGRKGTITVVPERKAGEGMGRAPSAYLTGIALWPEGPDFFDTDKLSVREVMAFEKVWPDVVTVKQEETVVENKDGSKTKTTEAVSFTTSVWKEKLESWIEAHAAVLHLVRGIPVQPVTVKSLTQAEKEDIFKARQARAAAGQVVVVPTAQKVRAGMRLAPAEVTQ